METQYLRQEDRTIRFRRYAIKKTIYYLQKSTIGIRVEVSRLNMTGTVEIKILCGDGGTVEKVVIDSITLSRPTKVQVDRVVEQFLSTSNLLISKFKKKSDYIIEGTNIV